MGNEQLKSHIYQTFTGMWMDFNGTGIPQRLEEIAEKLLCATPAKRRDFQNNVVAALRAEAMTSPSRTATLLGITCVYDPEQQRAAIKEPQLGGPTPLYRAFTFTMDKEWSRDHPID